jgi:hypothetical protein
MLHDRPPEPWHSFFLEVDKSFDQPVAVECIGGFALGMLYGLPRPTIDVDCISVAPVEETTRLLSLAGRGSALHRKYGIYFQHVGVVTVAENYADRLTLMFPVAYRHLLLMGLEAHDLALSKIERNSARDREDVRYLARAVPLDLAILERRYHSELRPHLANAERHDLTLRLWIEMLKED